MKIAILSHFNTFQDGYALHVGWRERARMLEYFGQDFDFLVNVRCKEGSFPNQLAVLQHPSPDSTFKKKVRFFGLQYRELLQGYDIVLTADMIYQEKGNFLPQSQAIRNIASKLDLKCLHWIHSGWIERDEKAAYPRNLRFAPLDTKYHRIVCLSYAERFGVARMYDMPLDCVYVVYNPKDFRAFHKFHPLAWKISDTLKLWIKDAVQVLPFCTSRMDAKGIDAVIDVFGALKRKGSKVALIFANANAGKYTEEIQQKKDLLTEQGLRDGEDYLFTSDWLDNKALPHEAVANLFSIANLFVFASWRETASNVLYEARISGNLLVLSNRVPALMEAGGTDALYFDATSRTIGLENKQSGNLQLVTYHEKESYFLELADKIIPRLPYKRHIWSYAYDPLWYNQMKPLLEGCVNGRN